MLVGDFDAAAVRPLLERYFGRIPRGKTEPPEMVTAGAAQHRREALQRGGGHLARPCASGGTRVPFVHKDRTVVDLVSDVLTGRTGRLYKGLVTGRQVANETSASVDLKKYEGVFQVEATVKDGKDPAAVEQAIYEEIEQLKNEPLPAEELQKVKNQAKANAYRRLSSPFSIAIQLMIYDGLGDWRYINTYAEEVDRVTAADIQRVAKEYFTKENRTVGVFLRKAGAAAADDDPEVAALPAPAQAMARQQIAQHPGRDGPGQAARGDRPDGGGQGAGAAGDEAGVRSHPQAGAGAPGRPGGAEEVSRSHPAVAVALAVLAPSPPSAAVPAAAQAPAIPDHPEKLTFKPIAYTPPRGGGLPRGPEERDGRLHRRGPDAAPRQHRLHRAHRALPRSRGQGGPGRLHRLADPPRRHAHPHRGAARREAGLPGRQRRAPTSATPPATPPSTACADNLDESLKVFVEMLREPRFQEDRLALAKEQALQEMKKRNDDSEDIEAREWNVLLYGEEHFTNRFTTEASVQSITRQDLVAFHRKYFHPANMVAAVSGSFSRPVMIQKLEAAFAGWPGTAADGAARALRDPSPPLRASTASRRTSTRAACPSACRRCAAAIRTSTPSR